MRAIFARLRLAPKLLICGVVFFLPIAVLLYYTLSGFQQQMEFTGRELAGVRALQPLSKLTILLSGRQMDSIAAGVDSVLADVRRAESQIAPLLPASTDADVLATKAAKRSPDSAENARVKLLGEVYAILPKLADSTNLILDSNLESYYLANLAVLLAPSLHQALSRDPQSVPDPATLKAVQHAVSVTVAEDRSRRPGGSSLQANLPAALATFESSAASNRLNAASALWETAISELHVVLNQRAARLRRDEAIALIMTLAAVGIASGLLFVVVRNISIPLACATSVADNIAAGRVSSAQAALSQSGVQEQTAFPMFEGNRYAGDEAFRLLCALRTMTESLDSLLRKVQKAYAQVDGATLEMAAALRQFEATAAEQTASTVQVAASSKEICLTADQLAQNMHAVTGMAAEATHLATAGLTGLTGINAAVNDTLEGAASVSCILNTISTKAASINSVLGTITKIANRTNLISLNAAIEAEKAGEHAAGFTTVALEIRRVADQTAVAALDIEKMLAEMQAAVNEGVKSMANYAERSRGNSVTVASITDDIGRSIDCTRKLGPQFEAVNSGMQMQAQAAREILQAMQQLSAAAGKTRDSLGQFRQIADRVGASAGVLHSEVARFTAV